MASSSSSPQPIFAHPHFSLDAAQDRIVRRDPLATPTTAPVDDEQHYQSLVESLAAYIRGYLQHRFGLVPHWIPADDAPAKCDVWLSPDWDTAPKLLVVLQNHVGSQLGMWSRSTCVAKGLRAGSMIPFLEQAQAQGYAVVVCNPNLNSVVVDGQKVAVPASAFPEAHSLYVYESFVAQAQARHVLLFGYGNGAILCKEMLQRQLVRCQQRAGEANRIVGIATVEASVLVQEDDSADVRAFLGRYAVDWEASPRLPPGHAIPKVRSHLGVAQALSVGSPAASSGADEPLSTAWSVTAGMDSVFRYFAFCVNDALQHAAAAPASPNAGSASPTTSPPSTPKKGYSTPTLLRHSSSHGASTVENRGHRFAVEEAARCGVPAPPSPMGVRPSLTKALSTGSSPSRSGSASSHGSSGTGSSFLRRLRRMVSSGLKSTRDSLDLPGSPGMSEDLGQSPITDGGGCRTLALTERLDISDFDLLKVVGKGAFGKVMLVKKKKSRSSTGGIYAMKVLNKDSVVKKGQIEHTMSERSILCQIRHPFIVRLRFAFQNETSLYLVTDYYTGGSLYYHLRKNGSFAEPRAKFYAAELLLALEHLHQHFIIYRDLKLENILMDSDGHIALTDFGLSKQNVRTEACATTFCGTAEYLAPELLRGKPYGAPVDWWSFGILLFEMMDGRTPFYNKNRKYMFHCIVHVRPTFPAHFSKPAQALLVRLLEPDPVRRWGAEEIKAHAFFDDVDFDKLYGKRLSPPFKPRVKNEMDLKWVPHNYQKLPPKESVVEPTGAGACEAAAFQAFTYHGDSHTLG